MKETIKDYAIEVATTIWQQILMTADSNTIGSWGISNRYGTYIRMFHGKKCQIPSLAMKVNGFNYKGWLYIGYDEGKDLYTIYKVHKDNRLEDVYTDIYCDGLSQALDKFIERGDMTHDEYMAKVYAEYQR